MKRRGFRLLAAVAIVFAVLAGRQLVLSRAENRDGFRSESEGNVMSAISHYDRSVHAYFPGNPYVKASLERLLVLAREWESKDPKVSLLACDAVRGGVYAIRSFYRPYADLLPEVNERIAVLRAREQVKETSSMTYEDALAFHRKVLAQDLRPGALGVLLTEFGFLGWVLCVVGLIWRGFDREGKMLVKPSVPWVAGIILFFALWIWGLLVA